MNSERKSRSIKLDAGNFITAAYPSSTRPLVWHPFLFLVAFFLCCSKSAAIDIELLANTGFESGASDPSWQAYPVSDGVSTSAGVVNLGNAHVGSWYAFVGDKTTNSTHARGVLRQDVTIPPYATTLTLRFYLNITSAEGTGYTADTMGAYLTTYPGDAAIATFGSWDNRNKDPNSNPKNYVLQTLPINVSAHAGEIVIFKFYGQTDDSLYTTFRIDDVSLKATVPDPNLTPYKPNGWSDKIVVSKQPNSTTDDSNFSVSDTIYVSWAGINAGNGPTRQLFYSTIYLDDVAVQSWSTDAPNNPSVPFSITGFSLGKLTAGLHTIRLKVDSGLSISETDETDNEYSHTFSVGNSLSISVNTPNSGNPLSACNPYSVTWTTSGDTSQVSYFKFGYSLDGGSTFTDAGDSISSSSTSLSWTPHALRSTQARVRIRAYNSSDQLLAEASNPNNFTITLPGGNPTSVPGTFNIGPGVGDSVQFLGASASSSSCSEVASYSWDFGDGATSILRNPTHKFYPANGSQTYNVTLKVTDANGETDQKTLPIYVSGQSLGAQRNGSFSLDPVNLATGNYIYQHTDLRIPGKGFPFEFTRFYNSKFSDQTGLPLGFGWTHSYNIRLTATSTNATVTFGDGHSELHTLSGGQYVAEAGVYDVLTNNPDGSFTLTSKDQSRRNFDSDGRLVSVADKNANTLSLAYANGILTNITDTSGRQIVFQSDTNGLITQITDPLNRLIQFQYDSQTNLVAVIDANNGTNKYSYDPYHQMTAAFDPRGTKYVQNTYDDMQRIVAYQTDAYTNGTSFFYDFIDHVTYVTNALSKSSVHRHDDRLLVTNIVDEAGNHQEFGYDANRNRTLVRDKNGNTTLFSYDSFGNVTNKTDAMTNITSIEYDSLNNPTRRIDALTNITTFGYDSRGNLTSTTNALGFVSRVQYDSDGLPVVLTDARGFSTTNIFDPQGNLATVIDAKGFASRREYDGVGRQIRQIDALNRTNSFLFDNNDNLLFTTNALGFVNAFTYDGNNNRITSQNSRMATTTNIFDLKDRLVATLAPLKQTNGVTFDALDRRTASFDALGNPTHYGFDDIGNLIAVTNALNEVTRFTFDPQGNQTSVIDPTGYYRTNFFDPLNRKTVAIDISVSTNLTQFDALGYVVATTNANGQVTRFNYDPIGRLTNVVDAAGQSVFFAYDENGNRIRTTDPNGHSWTNVFDELNRLVEQQNPDGTKTVFQFDPVGNVTNKITPNGDSINYGYDSLNRLTNIAYPSGTPISFAYDSVGNLTGMADSLGTTVWQYDLLNRLTSVTDPYGQVVTNGFDANGNRTTLTYPGNKVVTYSFDALNRMTSLTDWLGGVVTYGFDTRDNMIAATNANGTTISYAYDVAGRLVALTNASPSTGAFASYALSLDGIGNHQQSAQEQPVFPILPNQTNTYAYDADNHLISLDSQTVTHNANGDLTGVGTNSYLYDFEDRLLGFALAEASGSCGYDGLGNRLSRMVNGDSRRFVLDRLGSLTQVLVETDTNNVPIAFYVYGAGLAERITAGGQVATFHFDIQGSTVALTDSGGNVTDAYAYDSFGDLANSDGDSSQPFHYLGRYGIIDDSTGLLYARARYFSPLLGRFITKDPITGKDGDSQSLNRYVYALNNPLLFADVSGLCSQAESYNASWSDYGNALGGYWTAIIVDPAKAIYNFVFHPFRTADSIAYTAQHPGEVFGKVWQDFEADLSSNDLRRQGHAVGTVMSLFLPAAETKGAEAAATVNQYALRATEDGVYPVMRRGFSEPQGNIQLNAGDVWKYGTTKNPGTRYTQRFLDETGNGLRYDSQLSGSLEEALSAEKSKILDFLNENGVLPPGNKIIR